MAKNINTGERLIQAFPELPMDALMRDHNAKEKWEALTKEIDTFVDQHALPPAARKS